MHNACILFFISLKPRKTFYKRKNEVLKTSYFYYNNVWKPLFWKQRQPEVLTKLLLFVFESPKSNKSRMFVFVARFVSLFVESTESKNTHKKSDVIHFPPFSTKFDKLSAKGEIIPFDFLSFV